MAKKTSTRKKPEVKPKLNLDLIYIPKPNVKAIIFAAIAIIALGLSYYYINFALSQNHSFGFPLDDPWIHLTFAKNLAEYHSFSFFKNEIVTAGSTSPVYTFMLAIGFLITQNEMVLSYILGILFFTLSAMFFYRLSTYEFAKENLYAMFITAIFLVDKWMNFISGSGMETTMYIFILFGCAIYYKQRKALPFAIFLGLIMWGRPDGVTFMGALVFDYFIFYKFSNKKENLFNKNDLIKIGVIAGGILVIYFAMNLILSGSLLPNTYTAKLTYYTPEFRSRSDFLRIEIWQYFTRGAYALIFAGFVISVLFLFSDLFKKKYNPNLLYILFIVFLVFVYWLKLPYAHRFGRYMMPIIPFMILMSGTGYRDIAKSIGNFMKNRETALVIFFLFTCIILGWSFVNYSDNKSNYADECRYISDRQVAAAKWIKNNTNETDIIATHDVGAIGFYSGRKIVDVAGLITPELIDKLNDTNYNAIMTNFMKEKNVNYIAFLREWYRVVNVNPLFSTADTLPPEVMEVYKFIPEKTYIISGIVKSGIMAAQNAFSQKQFQQAMQIFNQLLRIETKASLIYFLLGITYAQLNDQVNFEKNMQKALEIFPEYREALFQYGYYKKLKGDFPAAKNYLEKCLAVKPDNKVKDLLKSVEDSLKTK
jgi:tetratricopeptide (TPR) repeat protein